MTSPGPPFWREDPLPSTRREPRHLKTGTSGRESKEKLDAEFLPCSLFYAVV